MAGLAGVAALVGYCSGTQALTRINSGLQAMAPLTAIMILLLAIGAAASTWRRESLVAPIAGVASILALLVLGAHLAFGADTISPSVCHALFGIADSDVGRTSTATALSGLLIAAALLLRRRHARAADILGGLALVLTGMALLGYLYGVSDLYALPMFNSMALNTAGALFLLASASLLTEPDVGWSAVLASDGLGGGATRRQLAFTALPVIAGWLLLALSDARQVGPAIAIALLVIVTVVPLALLILRDGRVLDELDRARRDKAALQEGLTREMSAQLADQAKALARESEERTKAEAVIYRAQRMEAVGQLTGGIAHDFNNLLMAIQGNLELLGRRLPPAEDRLHRYVAGAIAATERGAKVTGQLLAFSRSQRLDIRAIELQPTLHAARELIGSSLGPGIDIVMDLDTADAWATSDPDQLELAILNLAVNARDAMPDGGRLTVQSRPCAERLSEEQDTADYVAIRVIDTGCGMSQEVAEQAVEPFFTTKERGKGTGLGLAQVYGFVRQCGGDLRIISVPAVGTTIEMLLRCAVPVQDAAPASAASDADDKKGGAGRRVVVIDDDEDVRAVVVDALVSAGFDVVEAADGPTGLELLETVRPSAAVIDFVMPGMNGAEVARRAQDIHPGLPIVFVSGYSDTLALDGIAGAVVLRKPFDIRGLSRALDSVLH